MSLAIFEVMRHYLLFILSFCHFFIIAQEPYKKSLTVTAQKVKDIPEEFRLLLLDNSTISRVDSINEQIIDLVIPTEQDSILPRKWQFHRAGGSGVLTRPFGLGWFAVDMQRRKYVGTSAGGLSVPGKPHFTEYDVNWNLIPNLKKYQDMSWEARQAQMDMRKGKRKRDETKAPFLYPIPEGTLHKYDIHCELTPPAPYLSEINDKFYPVMPPQNLHNHHNFMYEKVTVGVYGAFVSDCNHTCHPEIHPYEWLWWMDIRGEKKKWYYGFFREYSNRFKGWSKPPRRGKISLPFIISLAQNNHEIQLDHITFGPWHEDGIKTISGIPSDASTFDFNEMKVNVSGLAGNHTITLTTNTPLHNQASRVWLSDLRYDESGKYLIGRVNLALSLEHYYCGSLEVVK